MLALFWASISLIVYTYLGYPLMLMVLSRFRSRTIEAGKDYLPLASLIVTVFNEEQRLQKKIANTLELDYPRDKLEIIFASDASTDGTDDIIRSYGSKGIKLVRSPHRGGKENAQKCAIEQAQGEIIVFSDVATMLGEGRHQKHRVEFRRPKCRVREQRRQVHQPRRHHQRGRSICKIRNVAPLARIAGQLGGGPERVVLRGQERNL
ncbi:MAG: glycosyltransferase [Desulfomonilia bacterium]